MATNAADDASAAPSLLQYINLANYVYTSGNSPSTFPTSIGYAPLEYSGRVVSALNQNTGFYGQAFISTDSAQSPDAIIAFEGTNLAHSPPSVKFTLAQAGDDHDIFEGVNAPSYKSALRFTRTAIKDAEADGVAADNIYLDGHSLGAAEAEYVAAKLNLPGTTFGTPGIPGSDFARSASSKLTNYVDYGDPVGNYSADPPQALGSVVQKSSILHYGGEVYTGSSSSRSLLTDIASEFARGSFLNKAVAAGEFAYGFSRYHQLANYATDLGLTIYNGDSSTGADAGFFSSLVGSALGSLLVASSGATAACFASGTRIDTARGSVAVEMLSTEDLVITASGERCAIRWLGHRTVDCRRHPRPQDVWPVRFAAHAFGPDRPARDLLVSPGHAICVDVAGEILIPASALINGTSVEQIEVDAVTYWHVELGSHDILLAEGLPAESYLEMGNRAFFAGTDVVAPHADPDAKVVTHADFCRPFVDSGPLLEAVKARLGTRAVGRAREGVSAAA